MKDSIKKVIIIGAGGHAKVVIDIILAMGEYNIVGCTSSITNQKSTLGIPLLGDDYVLDGYYRQGIRHAFVAIGDNKRRSLKAREVMKKGYTLINACSPWVYISQSVKMGVGIAIMPGVIINPDAVIGDNTIVNTGATVDHDTVIGANCHIAPGCNIAGNVKIGEGVFLGIGSSVIPDIKIGSWTVIGAGAVVVTNIPSHAIAAGIPARIQRKN